MSSQAWDYPRVMCSHLSSNACPWAPTAKSASPSWVRSWPPLSDCPKYQRLGESWAPVIRWPERERQIRLLLLFIHPVVSDSFETPWATAHRAPLFMGFPRQEEWNGLPFPSPGDLPDPGIQPASPELAAEFFTTEPPGKPKSG